MWVLMRSFSPSHLRFQEAHALLKKPAALVSAANMALKMGEASTARREYEQALRADGLADKLKQAISAKLQVRAPPDRESALRGARAPSPPPPPPHRTREVSLPSRDERDELPHAPHAPRPTPHASSHHRIIASSHHRRRRRR